MGLSTHSNGNEAVCSEPRIRETRKLLTTCCLSHLFSFKRLGLSRVWVQFPDLCVNESPSRVENLGAIPWSIGAVGLLGEANSAEAVCV